MSDTFSVKTMRREAGGVAETITALENVSGAPDETYQVRGQDGTSVTIHGDEVIVANREEDLRYYRLAKGTGDLRFSYQERLRMTPSDGPLGGRVDEECLQKDRALIEGALRMYERAKAEPEGFRPSDPFEE